MGVSIDHIPGGSRSTDAKSPEEYGTQPPLAAAAEFGTQPPLAPAAEFGNQPPASDARLKRRVRSIYGTQPPATSDARLKRDVRPL